MTHVARIAGPLAAVLATAGAATAADHTAQAGARAAIVEPMALRMQWATAMPTVRGGAGVAVFAGRMPSMAMGMMMPANARLMIRREDETGEPVTAPGAFEVVANGAGQALVVRTAPDADIRVTGGEAFAGGSLAGRAAASIDVARRHLILASATDSAPAAPEALVVMVQYN